MQIITIKGSYSYKEGNQYEGLICLIHFESADTESEINDACKSLKNIAGENDLVLVPFSHLTNNVKEFNEAKKYFAILNDKCKSSFGSSRVHAAPFANPKKFNVETPEPAEIKFLRFEPQAKNAIKAIYTDSADLFDKHMETTGLYKVQKKLIAHFADLIKEPIIDLACGSGFLLSEILKLDNINEVYANDFSDSMISKARERLKDNMVFFSSFDAEKITKLNSREEVIKLNTKFKTIVCCNLFFYLSGSAEAINNWKTILQQDGVIILIEEYPFLFPTNNENLAEFSNRLVQVHHACSPAEILKIMNDHGFKLLKDAEEKIDSRHSLHGAAFKLK